MKKGILYINQFFGQIGGEEQADFEPVIREGLVGPATALDEALDDVTITHTIICGDNYMGSHTEEALRRISGFLQDKDFDIFFAGPAFRAGRYGIACGNVCQMVQEQFKVPVVTSMKDESPGVEMFRQKIYILKGGKSAADMRKDIKAMAQLGQKLAKGEPIGAAQDEGYFGRGERHQTVMDPPIPAADRVVDMLLKKLNNQPFQSELPIPKPDRVPIAPAVKDLSKATIAFVTSGGIVPKDNPDRIQSASATKWGRYNISQYKDRLPAGEYKTIHAGYDPAAANEDPNRIFPLDALRAYEREGKFGKLHDYYYATVGTGTTQGEAARMGREIAQHLHEGNVDAVILVST